MIPGMDKGVLGMKVGDTKTIKCTPAEAYGEKSDDAMIRENTSPRSRHAYSVHFVEERVHWDPSNWLQRPADIPFKPLTVS